MGNTTSERVSGERHGSKSHRSDGSGTAHPSKEHPHKIMVGSTDDPSVFSSHDSKIPGDKEFVSWQPDLEESVKPSQQARPTVIRWADGGKEVFISGSFNNWSTKIPLIKSHNDFVAILDLPEGEHQYKFFVDGQWVHDPSEPVVTSQMGTINNLIHVKKSDFEVFDALKVDSLESSETSGRVLSQVQPQFQALAQPKKKPSSSISKEVDPSGCWLFQNEQTYQVHHPDLTAKRCMCTGLRNASNPLPSSRLTSSRSSSTRTPISRVTRPYCPNPTTSCSITSTRSPSRMA
ncbi:5'-AMP-activated protein kinase subunit beta-2 isoform X1 [Gallus gallus]|uniref:5'-AMP-activated protein kinase subunit beta-2 isoform X1 n=1 Tax=Gallus gallus TaxID=9031 RepID=UPI001AE7200B|nr:5'-AMP-activated protein kinase subunit beta-2 isoform X1 [Gallus gallus]XP_046778888.1 5'-AMP-activated protein kinase subunit beta-2 isoform X1 [Gallus gallus]XP_046778889.1 5'-AMP-activated protein kinase subunit beta-2 isoform X1 [Gallus gallus]XP_046778890.1 5'-AMP-activated protein kinase subunit beta-2 isoform X1 [Gallus gallus]XP_046778891.1 5'-AMP-activated protein kinase subunit beta-2 isoform X1 [Gallus gallus]XP_046778892.1 5'-AMP-activated protein kinase subunit beta-2 isoform 